MNPTTLKWAFYRDVNKLMYQFSCIEFRYDFLYIYDGENEFATLIGQFTGLSSNTVQSTGRHLFINFQSDESEARTGFNLRFDTGK